MLLNFPWSTNAVNVVYPSQAVSPDDTKETNHQSLAESLYQPSSVPYSLNLISHTDLIARHVLPRADIHGKLTLRALSCVKSLVRAHHKEIPSLPCSGRGCSDGAPMTYRNSESAYLSRLYPAPPRLFLFSSA